VTIPSSALRGKSVFLLDDGKAVERPVDVVNVAGTSARIAGGLAGGERLIVNPPETLQSGDLVSAAE
jgi:hypothetical protein